MQRRKRILDMAMVLLVLSVTTIPPTTTAQSNPGSNAVDTVHAVVLCELAGADSALAKALDSDNDGYYEGRPTVKLLIHTWSEDGKAGENITRVSTITGEGYQVAYDTVLEVLTTGEATAREAIDAAASITVHGLQTTAATKCYFTHEVVNPTWDHYVGSFFHSYGWTQWDCWVAPSGPFYNWVIGNIQPPEGDPVPPMPPCDATDGATPWVGQVLDLGYPLTQVDGTVGYASNTTWNEVDYLLSKT